jgi:hypothetical protein
VVTGHSPEQPAHFDIALARRYLRQRQAYWARPVGAPELGDSLALARERAAFRQASAVRDGPWYRTGPVAVISVSARQPVMQVLDSGLPLHPVWATSEEK